MKVLILGHNGMLGHMVHKYLFTKSDCEIVTTNFRWPTDEFKMYVSNFDGEFIINCIGAIHQRTDNFDVNVELPIWLEESNICNVTHPGTDCEIDDDDYGISKKTAADYILKNGNVTKIIKTSIVGTELNTKASLLEWFLNVNDNEINGYGEYYWNGNTTLQWAKICYNMMVNWDNYDILNIPATECISKYELLKVMKDVYNKDIIINKNLDIKVNKCLVGNIDVPNIKEQLNEMKDFV